MQRWGEHTEDSHTLQALIAVELTEHAVDQVHKKKEKRKKMAKKWTTNVGLGLRRCSVVARLQQGGALLVGQSAYVARLKRLTGI